LIHSSGSSESTRPETGNYISVSCRKGSKYFTLAMKLEKKINLNWKRYPVGFKLGKKSSSSKLNISNWRIGKIQFR
jgi:hypothetical protein